MNKILKIFTLLLFISACGDNNLSQLTIKTSNGDVVYKVETASTSEELQTGLMNRDSLASDRGMLFDLSSANIEHSIMWMKDTQIALDMLFITNEGFVMWIKENATPMSEELIIPPFKAGAVLEINAGEVAKKGIKIGDIVKHPILPIKNTLPQISSEANSIENETTNSDVVATEASPDESSSSDSTTEEKNENNDTTTEANPTEADTTAKETEENVASDNENTSK